jgi:hypothetical protein
MNRRKFLTTGAAAVAATTTVSGCLGTGVLGDSSPDVPVEITTSDAFDERASHEPAEVSVEETDDGTELLKVEYLITPEVDECVDVSANVTMYDPDDVVMDEGEYREQYDPDETYQMTHKMTDSPSEVGRIDIALSVNPLSGMCYM